MKMKNSIRLLFIALAILLFSSCTYHNEVDYFGDVKDTCNVSNMSFKADIQPILQANCVMCHSSSSAAGGIKLDSYANVMPHAKSGILSKVINHKFGVAAMPQDADKLPKCTISQVDGWITQGYLNN
jgi:hypothetical protein